LLPRRGIHSTHSQLALVLFGDHVANQFCQFETDPRSVGHDVT
jgi:hypothetical protein